LIGKRKLFHHQKQEEKSEKRDDVNSTKQRGEIGEKGASELVQN